MPANIYEEYFEWLFDLVCAQRYSKPIYRKLLMRLHDTEFRYSIPRDRNRAEILKLKSISEIKNLMPRAHPSLHACSVASVTSDSL